jgi:hypothetical protein
MRECRTVRHPCSQSGTGMNRNADAGTSPVQEKGDPVWYRNAPDRAEIQDAGMPMPAASISMPRYGEWYFLLTPPEGHSGHAICVIVDMYPIYGAHLSSTYTLFFGSTVPLAYSFITCTPASPATVLIQY